VIIAVLVINPAGIGRRVFPPYYAYIDHLPRTLRLGWQGVTLVIAALFLAAALFPGPVSALLRLANPWGGLLLFFVAVIIFVGIVGQRPPRS
jgi:high-affinity Fe2+/Pb2+ permease